MKPRSLHWRLAALDDIEALAAYYASEGGAPLGLKFVAALEAAVALIAEHPESGSRRHAYLFPDLPAPLRFHPLRRFESRLSADGALQRVFSSGHYAWDWQYNGFVTLKRHFFPQIGNLKAEGEEFECAQFIANEMDGVECWIRNVEKKASSFSLPTSSDRFYPDFLVRTWNGGIIAAECKGAHLATGKDSEEKKRIGALWERRSGGRCAFAWVENKDWAPLEEAAKRCSAAPEEV